MQSKISSLNQGRQVKRLKLKIQGIVQGVGFRPFVYHTAIKLGLAGWIKNSARGVEIELEGDNSRLEEFLHLLETDKPPLSRIVSSEVFFHDPVRYEGFRIMESDRLGDKSVLILPDIATCPDCLREIFDPSNRRYLYPFTNCTNCGPRYSIIESLPYDRANTTMREFCMCNECQREYENPIDRRFHAQPNACPDCGPHLELWDKTGKVIADRHSALMQACEAVMRGAIVAVKGLGGFHLIVDAQNSKAVKRLRFKKGREEKPFALMFPDLDTILDDCEVSELERELLLSAQAPIVLLQRRHISVGNLFREYRYIAPDNQYLGIMLPYTPLHHLLMANLGFPIVATSGNLSEEPICIDENEPLTRLNGIADLFLVHNRCITRHLDDSIVRIMAGRELVLRRARGYAPLPIHIESPKSSCLATGGHLKNSVAISVDENIIISQHIGDLDNEPALNAFNKTIESLCGLYDFRPDETVCDKHPDYLSSKYSHNLDIPCSEVQHHYAHVLSCMAENNLTGTVLGISWDGTGYGLDGTVWGGEFLLADPKSFSRFAHLRTFPLPGGERAVSEPRRSALGILFEIFGERLFLMKNLRPLSAFTQQEIKVVKKCLERRINTPPASSAGRLFDAISSLLGLCQIAGFEGQAAMKLEHEAESCTCEDLYEYKLEKQLPSYIIDWEPMILGIIDDIKGKAEPGHVAAKAHNTLAGVCVETATLAGIENVVLTGGCFQNKYLTEKVIGLLKDKGFIPHWHRYVPPNDGGLSLGQIMAALWKKTED